MRLLTVCILLIITGCSTLQPGDSAAYLQCVPYARKVSGIQIYGDAHTWWKKAKATYARGKKPEPGAVLVLSKTDRLRYGHVAVVKRIVGKRKIEVEHANWGKDIFGRGNIYKSMSVTDISSKNDWSKVRFWSPESESYGVAYRVSGFVYNQPLQSMAGQASPL